MQLGGGVVVHFVDRVVGQQVPDDVVIDTEAAQQHVAGGNAHDLGGGECADHVGSFFRHAQAEQGFGFVLTDESLRQHEVGHVGFADLGEDLFVTHDSAPEWGRFV